MDKICRICKEGLSLKNWHKSLARINNRICKRCLNRKTVEWFKDNPKKCAEYTKKSYWRHRNKRLLAKKEWDIKNRNWIAKRDKQKRQELRNKILNAYGNKCICCGESQKEFLTIDHTDNDGNVDRKKIKSRAQIALYRIIIKEDFPKRYQLMCYNCNCARAKYNGICPHKFSPAEFKADARKSSARRRKA